MKKQDVVYFHKSIKYMFFTLGTLLFLLSFMVAIPKVACAQSLTVKGTVKDASTNLPLPGVDVVIKGTTNGNTTNGSGIYKLSKVGRADTLIFSFIGYKRKIVPVRGRSTININLQPTVIRGKKMVVVGYGKQRQEDVSVSLSSVKTATIQNQPVVNETNNLAGRVSGIITFQGSGEPGNNSATIHIRGVSTMGNANPLVIVDGVPRNFSEINPQNIKSVKVLKGAAAVAPYGMAGANGVILVTTKSGQAGPPSVSYNGYFGIQNPTFVPRMVNAYQFAKLKNLAQANAGGKPAYSQTELQGFKNAVNGNPTPEYPNSNALNAIIRKNAPLTRNSLIISGGSKKVTYYASLGWTYQGGMWRTANDSRYNGSMRIDAQPTKTTHVSVYFTGWNEKQHYPGGNGDVMYQAYRTPAVSPVYYPNGDWGSWDGRSAIGLAFHSGYTINKNRQVYSSLYIKQDLPLPGLDVKARISYDPYDTFSKGWYTPIPTYRYDPKTKTYNEGYLVYKKPKLNESYRRTNNYTFQGYLDYIHSFGKNNVNITGVFESSKGLTQDFSASRQDYNLYLPELNMGSSVPANISNGGSASQTRRLGVVFDGNYNYANTYLLTVTGRYDGDYYFAPGHRFGFFPAVAVGWNISNEKFFKNRFPWVSNLKLRGSWGYSGNLAGAPFQYLSAYGIYGGSANFNGAPTQGIYERKPANTSITWEKALKEDVGLNLSLWNDKVTLTADYFYQKRSNMLLAPNVTVPVSYGIGLNQVNAGVMSNHGIDFTIGYNKGFANGLVMNLTGNFTWAHNKLINIFESPATYNNPRRRRTGRQLGTMFGYKAIGLYTKSDFNSNGKLKKGIPTVPWTVHPGDIRYADLNHDGKITPSDRTVIGNPRIPGIEYGLESEFKYKQFALDILFQGTAQSSFYVSKWLQSPFDRNGNATLLQYKDHWSASNPNPHALFPRVAPAQTPNNSQGSSYWVRNASYIRIKSAELSYSLPGRITHMLSIHSMQIYLAGQNLFTWDPGMHYQLDPEAGAGSGQYYFQQRVFSIGANVHF